MRTWNRRRFARRAPTSAARRWALCLGLSLSACHGIVRPPADTPEEDGGANGVTSGDGAVELTALIPSTVVINEIMYAPVAENADQDNHEFVELYNRSKEPIALAGWKVWSKKGVAFTFPPGASIGPGQFRVLAKNRKMLAAVTAYGLAEEELLGDYSGQLDNGGDTLALS